MANAFNLNNEELAYIAGLFDGEGCITIGIQNNKKYNPLYTLHVNITNTHHGIILWLHNIFGGSISHYNNNTQRCHRDCFKWGLLSNRASAFIQLIFPYLKIKKERAKLAIEFQTKLFNSPYKRFRTFLPKEELDWRSEYKEKLSILNGTLIKCDKCGKIIKKSSIRKERICTECGLPVNIEIPIDG